jgi:hypothetical protein
VTSRGRVPPRLWTPTLSEHAFGGEHPPSHGRGRWATGRRDPCQLGGSPSLGVVAPASSLRRRSLRRRSLRRRRSGASDRGRSAPSGRPRPHRRGVERPPPDGHPPLTSRSPRPRRVGHRAGPSDSPRHASRCLSPPRRRTGHHRATVLHHTGRPDRSGVPPHRPTRAPGCTPPGGSLVRPHARLGPGTRPIRQRPSGGTAPRSGLPRSVGGRSHPRGSVRPPHRTADGRRRTARGTPGRRADHA